MKRIPFFCANWKMNLPAEGIQRYVQHLASVFKKPSDTVSADTSSRTPTEVVLAVPFPFLREVYEVAHGTSIKIAAQNAHWEKAGTFTGEISAPMLRSLGATFVIVGHSERRAQFAETDAVVREKVAAVLAADMTPILCVGETWTERRARKTSSVVRRQLSKALAGVKFSSVLSAPKIIIAYEPIWAISSGTGRGRTARPEEAQAVHLLIRSFLARRFSQLTADKIRILYGGSVNPDNATQLLMQPDIDGALVGGASLKSTDFSKIMQARK